MKGGGGVIKSKKGNLRKVALAGNKMELVLEVIAILDGTLNNVRRRVAADLLARSPRKGLHFDLQRVDFRMWTGSECQFAR